MSLPPVTGGTLYGVGVGPGEADYLTLRAREVIEKADLVAYFRKRVSEGLARATIAPFLKPGRAERALVYPVTTEARVGEAAYDGPMHAFYEESAAALSVELSAGRSVALIAEGDPMFYGSFMHLWRRLSATHPVEIVPGVTGMSGAAARAGIGLAWGDDALAILPGTLPEAELVRRLALSDGVVVMKIGRHLAKVRRALEAAGMADRAIYVERATMAGETILPLGQKGDDEAPYFSMILVPGRGRAL